MITEKEQRLLSRYLDGNLAGADREGVESRLQTDSAFRALKTEYEAIGQQLNEFREPAGVTLEAAWASVRREIRLARDEDGSRSVPWHFGSRLQWAGGMIAAVFLILGAWVLIPGPAQDAGIAKSMPAEVEWVETAVPDAMTMVYQDDETGLTVIWIMEAEEETDPAHAES